MNTPNFHFNQDDLDRLIAYRIADYQEQEDSQIKPGAIVSVFEDYPLPYLKCVQELTKDGYTLHEYLPFEHTGRWNRCYMVKPDHMQQADISAIRVQVEKEYRAQLEDAKAAWLDEQSRKLLKQKMEQEAAKVAALEAKHLAQLRKDLEDSLSK